MFDSEIARAVLVLIAHPAFQGAIAVLSLLIAIITAIIGTL